MQQTKHLTELFSGTVFCVILCGLYFCEKSQAGSTDQETRDAAPSTFSCSTDSCSTGVITKFVKQGEELTAEEVNKLEEQLIREPNDLVSRAKLMGFYSVGRFTSENAKKSYRKHLLWIIENKSDNEIASSIFASETSLDADTYAEAKKLWLQQIEKNPDKMPLIGNAANFFFVFDSNQSELLFKKAQSLEPNNPQWPQWLAKLYTYRALYRMPYEKPENAKKSLEELEKSLALLSSETEKFYILNYTAKFAYYVGDLNKAENYAKEALLLAPKFPKDWNYGNAIHHSNIVLGRIALTRGDIEAAKKHLIEAGKTPGSPQLNSFGPNMALAKELLEKKETQVVLDYFELCGKFWKMSSGRLDKWSAQVKNGQIPDFGANLLY